MDPDVHDYTEVAEWTEDHSGDTKPPDDTKPSGDTKLPDDTKPSSDTKPPDDHQQRRYTLPAKPIPLPKPKINKISSVDRESLATQRKERLPMPLPRNEGKPLPSLPTSVTTKLSNDDVDLVLEEPSKVAKVTSQPYVLDKFYQEYPLPQFVSVVGGHLGVTEEYSMSEGEELVLFFVKTSRVVVASSERKSEWYYIPQNSSLQFVPNQYIPADDNTVKGEDYFQQFKTVADLLNKKGELPKVVKVCKTYNGKSAQSSVVAGELIFPQKTSVSSFTRKKVLECLNSKNKLLKLETTCEGNFSINPADVKLYLVELLHYFKEFPISVMVINDHVGRSKSSSLSTGSILRLDEPEQLQSYICSTDVHGKMNYPLMELPMSMPIEIQSIEFPDLDMKPIYSKIQHTYENFSPSLIGKNMFNAQSTSMLATQQALYEEVRHDECTNDVYDLEKPSLIYDSIPAEFNHSGDVDHDFHPMPAIQPVTPVDTRPPMPPPRNENVDKGSPLPPPRCNPPSAAKNRNLYSTEHKPAEIDVTSTDVTSLPSKADSSVSNDAVGRLDCAVNPTYISTQHSIGTTDNVTLQTPTVPNVGGTNEENIAYLKTFSLDKLLQLLENMNLGQYKENFEGEQIDGEMIVHLGMDELADLGVDKRIHRTRLLKLIDGTISAKKYESGEYAFLKKKQSLP